MVDQLSLEGVHISGQYSHVMITWRGISRPVIPASCIRLQGVNLLLCFIPLEILIQDIRKPLTLFDLTLIDLFRLKGNS